MSVLRYMKSLPLGICCEVPSGNSILARVWGTVQNPAKILGPVAESEIAKRLLAGVLELKLRNRGEGVELVRHPTRAQSGEHFFVRIITNLTTPKCP